MSKFQKIQELSKIYSELNNYFFAVCQGHLLISDYVVIVSNLAPKIDELQNDLGIIGIRKECKTELNQTKKGKKNERN